MIMDMYISGGKPPNKSSNGRIYKQRDSDRANRLFLRIIGQVFALLSLSKYNKIVHGYRIPTALFRGQLFKGWIKAR